MHPWLVGRMAHVYDLVSAFATAVTNELAARVLLLLHDVSGFCFTDALLQVSFSGMKFKAWSKLREKLIAYICTKHNMQRPAQLTCDDESDMLSDNKPCDNPCETVKKEIERFSVMLLGSGDIAPFRATMTARNIKFSSHFVDMLHRVADSDI